MSKTVTLSERIKTLKGECDGLSRIALAQHAPRLLGDALAVVGELADKVERLEAAPPKPARKR